MVKASRAVSLALALALPAAFGIATATPALAAPAVVRGDLEGEPSLEVTPTAVTLVNPGGWQGPAVLSYQLVALAGGAARTLRNDATIDGAVVQVLPVDHSDPAYTDGWCITSAGLHGDGLEETWSGEKCSAPNKDGNPVGIPTPPTPPEPATPKPAPTPTATATAPKSPGAPSGSGTPATPAGKTSRVPGRSPSRTASTNAGSAPPSTAPAEPTTTTDESSRPTKATGILGYSVPGRGAGARLLDGERASAAARGDHPYRPQLVLSVLAVLASAGAGVLLIRRFG